MNSQDLKGVRVILEIMEIKPNFTVLAKAYGCDRRTAKKRYYGIENKTKRNKPSRLDQYKELINQKLSIPGINIKAIFEFIKMNINESIGTYSNFVKYVNKHCSVLNLKDSDAHVLFETDYGKQFQFDWKGPMSLHTKDGEVIKFYVFSLTLSASRLHIYKYSKFMTRESVQKSIVESFEYVGGMLKEGITDNMSSIINYSQHEFVDEFKEFAKDMGFTPYHCKVDHPFTKGKDESCNRFVNWLKPYDYEFESEDELIDIIKRINIEVNKQPNQTTNYPPISLFQLEKEHLQPLPRKDILDKYKDTLVPVKVQNTMLIYYKGSKYSVPKKYINQTVKVKEFDNKLYIYYNKELITTHDISDKKINYHEEDYVEGLSNSMPNKSIIEIENIAEENLKLLERITK